MDMDHRVRDVLARHWGFDTLRPMQGDAIAATLAGRDSLVVMPTGGGKSLCYQLPPLVTGRLTLVVSPLIALMQDQVAGLRLAGVPAAAAHSNLTAKESADLREQARSGDLRLLFIAPERLLIPDVLAWLVKLKPGAIAIDEAHCISKWGHDFRPEYRRLAELRAVFPGVPVGAYTATATPRVREDIAQQLGLADHAELVGVFDRPNLTYRILPREDHVRQIVEAIRRQPAGAAIVYCISRKDTESLAASLSASGVPASVYHAGLDARTRTKVSRGFRDEAINVICATVAFGMGIDRPDVRLVAHASLPKSLEHYQQETGRAGRDGLPAECLMLYSGADVPRWQRLVRMGWEESGAGPEVLQAQLDLLSEMQNFAASARCRHATISAYFGQTLEPAPGGCGACDVCLQELHGVDDAHDTARKIISCVARLQQPFGAGHIADVLLGASTARIRERGHDSLSTYGLLRGVGKERVVGFIHQLVDAGHLARAPGEYPVIWLGNTSAAVLKNDIRAVLVEPKMQTSTPGRQRAERPTLGEDEGAMFDELRGLRRRLAAERGLPPHFIMSVEVIHELCRVRPSTPEALLKVRGIGSRKAAEFGADLLAAIGAFCDARGLARDVTTGPVVRGAAKSAR